MNSLYETFQDFLNEKENSPPKAPIIEVDDAQPKVGEIFWCKRDMLIYRCLCHSISYEDISQFEEHLMLEKFKDQDMGELIAANIEEALIDIKPNISADTLTEGKTTLPQKYETQIDDDCDLDSCSYGEDMVSNIDDRQSKVFVEDLIAAKGVSNCGQKTIDTSLPSSSCEDESDIERMQISKKPKRARKKYNRKEKPVGPFACEDCSYITQRIQNLRHHRKRMHSGMGYNFKCEICERPFKLKCTYIAHLRRHNPTKNYICSYCAKSFHTVFEMRQHEMSHSEARPYECQRCGNFFRSNSNLKYHQTYCGKTERPFSCDFANCDKSFKTSLSLRKHKETHSAERNYACPHCELRFTTKKVLQNHVKIHINARAYKCNHCTLAFNQRTGLMLHLRNVHKIKDESKSKYSWKSQLEELPPAATATSNE